jgi:hypothetical protein
MWFHEVWRRLGAFAKAEPEAFRFLEMQDHVEYLDRKSRQLELSVLMPLLFAGQRLASEDGTKPALRRERSFRNSTGVAGVARAAGAAGVARVAGASGAARVAGAAGAAGVAGVAGAAGASGASGASGVAGVAGAAGAAGAVPVAVLMALLWGAFVGLVKASRLGYLPLDDKKLAQAGTACWRLIAPELSRSRTRTKGT